uniref:Preprotein-translocase subunit g n=1 Tax=Pedobesia claviformis TaxID=2364088 RepID=A0A386B0W0_9CHLO|nr:hypothetical protein Ycf47 [Pedobesia claviformis]AYC65327.1 hypothetical protein Ycf47 [Pedobesia claviformis]
MCRKRFLIGLILIILLIPQTPNQNYLLTDFNESGLFNNYLESIKILNKLTIGTIILFFISVLL